MNDCSDRMYTAERVVAQTFPVYESRFKTDAHTPFKLFDCLVPELKKHFRVPIAMLPKGYDTDIKMQIQLNREKNLARTIKNKALKEEVTELRAKVEQLKIELETIDWHIKFERDGRTPKEILKDYDELVVDNREKQQELDRKDMEHEAEVEKWKKKIRTCMKKLQSQQDDVIKPLLLEMKVRDEIVERLKQDYDCVLRDLKKLNTIVRLPIMVKRFQQRLNAQSSNEDHEKD